MLLDWESAGPESPSHELGMVIFEYGLGDPSRMLEVEDDDEAAVDEVAQGGEAGGIRTAVGELDGDVRDGSEVVRDVEGAGVVGSHSRTIAPGSAFVCTSFG